MVFLERKSGIAAGVPFGRADLSIGANGGDICALLRSDGPVGPGFQGMPEKPCFHVFNFIFLFYMFGMLFMNIVNEHGWISDFWAE